jgi:PAS domain S-box-containing protein
VAVLPVAAVICVAAANLLLAGVFAIVDARDRRPGQAWFACACMFEGLRHMISLLPGGSATYFAGVATFGVAVLALVEGSFRFASRPPSRAFRVAIVLMIAWQVAVFVWQPDFVVRHLPVCIFITIARLLVARMLWAAGGPWLGRGVATLAMALWGLHALSYPFLANVPSAAPWGFALSALLGLMTGLGVVIAYFERAREEADASEARLRSVFESASDGIATLDYEGRVVTANPALARLLGFDDPRELESAKLGELVQRDRSFTDTTVSGVETWQRRDSETRLVSVSISKARTGDRLDRVDVFVRDVTRETRMKLELEETRRIEALGRLAGGVAHDFNNLLQVIGSVLEIASRPGDPERYRQHLALAREASTRGAELTRQLLAVGRRQTVEARDVDLAQVVRDFAPWVGRLLGDVVELELELEPGAHVVSADRGQLEQILVNLVTNARDAMPGGGRVRVLLRAGDRARVLLEVRDEGMGMDEAVRARIFEPFFTTKERGQGTGLGLATVHGIAAQHGWAIEVDSRPGRGTSFTIAIPRSSRAGHALAPPTEHTKVRARGGRVVLIDDDALLRRVSTELLRDAGYDVRAIAPAEVSAREVASACDVLVTDVQMPGTSGPELVRRARSVQPGLGVVFVSGYAADEKLALDARTAFVAKPFRGSELIAAIENVRARSTLASADAAS